MGGGWVDRAWGAPFDRYGYADRVETTVSESGGSPDRIKKSASDPGDRVDRGDISSLKGGGALKRASIASSVVHGNPAHSWISMSAVTKAPLIAGSLCPSPSEALTIAGSPQPPHSTKSPWIGLGFRRPRKLPSWLVRLPEPTRSPTGRRHRFQRPLQRGLMPPSHCCRSYRKSFAERLDFRWFSRNCSCHSRILSCFS